MSAPNDDKCTICYEDFTDLADLEFLPCAHKFHSKCIQQWLSQKSTCPLCKISIYTQDLDENGNPVNPAPNHNLEHREMLESVANIFNFIFSGDHISARRNRLNADIPQISFRFIDIPIHPEFEPHIHEFNNGPNPQNEPEQQNELNNEPNLQNEPEQQNELNNEPNLQNEPEQQNELNNEPDPQNDSDSPSSDSDSPSSDSYCPDVD
jgi:hypothetical protein